MNRTSPWSILAIAALSAMATAFLVRADADDAPASPPPAVVAPKRAVGAAVLAGTDGGRDVCVANHASLGIDAAPLEARFQAMARGASSRVLLEIYAKNGSDAPWTVRRDALRLMDDAGRPIAFESPPEGATGFGAAATATLAPGESLRWVVGIPQGTLWRGGGATFGDLALVRADAVLSDLSAWRSEPGRAIQDALLDQPLPKRVR